MPAPSPSGAGEPTATRGAADTAPTPALAPVAAERPPAVQVEVSVDLPALPELPNLLDLPDLPDLPQLPKLAPVPELPRLPEPEQAVDDLLNGELPVEIGLTVPDTPVQLPEPGDLLP